MMHVSLGGGGGGLFCAKHVYNSNYILKQLQYNGNSLPSASLLTPDGFLNIAKLVLGQYTRRLENTLYIVVIDYMSVPLYSPILLALCMPQ